MMMAHDSTPTRPELSAQSVAALTSALEKFLTDENEVATLLPALQLVAREARQKNMHAEHLLLALKDVWYSLPQLRDTRDTERLNRQLQRIVTLCIREYYSG